MDELLEKMHNWMNDYMNQFVTDNTLILVIRNISRHLNKD